MALKISDRVKETTVTTGTGTVTLAGAVTGFRTFGSVLSLNDTTYYAIVSSSEFEVGIGTFTSSTTLTRDTVLSSSNSNLKVDFGAGSKNVFITQPADKAIYQDASGNVAGLNTDNVTEGSTNLYFTDERVDDRVGSLLVAGDNVTLSYDDAAGTLTISATEDNLSNNTTDDLAEGSTNLYYTSARANADFDTRLATKDTDDLSEGATNLYYTDARADARVNLQTGSNLDLSSKSTSDLSEGSNLYYTTARFDSAFSGKSTSDLSEGTNLYYTDARFDTRLASKTTDNLTEGSNLYYTNERVDDRVSNLLQDGTGISFTYDDSNNVLTPTVTLSPFSTTNLSEGTNLYFTNERVDDRVANLLTAGSNITLTYDDTAGTLTIAGVEDDLSNNDTDDLSEGATNLYFTNERVDDRVSALVQNGTGISWSYNDVSGTLTPTISLSAFSTSDLSEGTNLYYTTARFDSAFSGKSTSDLSEGTNLYYTTARFDSAFSGKTTDNLTEGATNLYYTDTRANAAIDARVTQSFVNALNVTAAGVQANSVALGTDTTGNYIATIAGTANKITVTGSGSESAAVTLTLPDDVQIANDLTVAGDLTVNGATTTLGTTNLEVSDNLFELNAGLTTAPVNDSGMLIQRGTSDNAIFMWDESADKFTLGTTTSDATVTGNIVITTGSLVANLEGNVTGNVTGTVSSLSNHDTGDLAEGTNLYYTDARSRSAISASGDISYDSSTGVISFTQATAPVTSVNTLTGAVVLDTDDISEGVSNLYYTAARFNSAFAAKSTSDLSEGTNLYLTQERVEDYVGGMVSGNTETGIAVTYDDTNGKLNFVIDTLNQDTTGNAATATALQTARNFSLTGDVTASAVSFDGTANVALSTSIAANTVGITELNVTDGTNGQVLTTDGAGNLSFSSVSGYSDSDVESYLDGGTSTPTFASATVSGDLTVDTSTLKVDSTNNRVGIGTASPSQDLELNKDAANVNLNIRSSDTGNATLLLGDQSDLSVASITLDNSSNDLIFKNNNQQEAMRIDSSLNVGIGNSSPQRRLTVGDGSGSEILSIYAGSTSASALHFTDTNTTTDYQGFVTYDHVAEGLRFGAAEAEGMRLTSTGLGIGVTSLARDPLHVHRAATGDCQIHMTNTSTGSTSSDGMTIFTNSAGSGIWQRENCYFRIATNNTERFRLAAGGELTLKSDTDTIATFMNNSDNDHNFKFELVDASDLAVLRLNGKDGGDNKFIIGYGSTHTSTPNMLALKSNTASGELGFFTDSTQRMHISPTGEVGIGTDNPLMELHVNTSGTSGLTGIANRGMIITDSVGARLVLEDTGATSNRKNFMLRSESDAFTISGLNDDGTSFTTENMFVISGSSSNVGIGTGNPSSKLHVVGSEVLFDNTGGDFTLKLNTNAVGDKNEIIMGDTGTPLAKFGVGGTANDIITGSDGQDFNIGTSGGGRAINFSTNNYASVEMKLDGGNLGIGTTSPSNKLTVDAGSTVLGGITVSGSAAPSMRITDTTNNHILYHIASDDLVKSGSSTNCKYEFMTNDTTAMTIDTSQNVGIGTSPAVRLHAYSAIEETIRVDGNAGKQAIHFRENGTLRGIVGFSDGSAISTSLSDNDFAIRSESNLGFVTGGANLRVLIDTTGRLTVGNASALSLGVIGSKFNGTTQNGIVVETTRDATGSTFIRFNDSDSAAIGSITQNGASTVAYNTSSDYRLKENVVYDWTALDRLNQLQPARFNFIADADTTVDGFLAHEVASVVPEAITGTHNEVEVWKEGEELPKGVNVGDNKTDEDGNTIPVYQGIDQSKLVPLLVKAVQELSDKVEALEAQLQGN